MLKKCQKKKIIILKKYSKMQKFITGLDIGTAKIKILVVSQKPKGKLELIYKTPLLFS